jgi:hypothetical protein
VLLQDISKIDEEINNQESNVPPKKEKLKKMKNLSKWKSNQLEEETEPVVEAKSVFFYCHCRNLMK